MNLEKSGYKIDLAVEGRLTLGGGPGLGEAGAWYPKLKLH